MITALILVGIVFYVLMALGTRRNAYMSYAPKGTLRHTRAALAGVFWLPLLLVVILMLLVAWLIKLIVL